MSEFHKRLPPIDVMACEARSNEIVVVFRVGRAHLDYFVRITGCCTQINRVRQYNEAISKKNHSGKILYCDHNRIVGSN